MLSWNSNAVAADEAVGIIKSGMRVFLHGAAATPTRLVEALARRTDLSDVTIYSLHTAGPAPFVEADCAGRFHSISLFAGPPVRKAINEGRADFIPVFLSDIPALFTSGRIPLDVAILQLSPPDKHGYTTLGTSVDAALAAAHSARYVIAEINEQMPRSHGNTLVHMRRLQAFVHSDFPLYEHPRTE